MRSISQSRSCALLVGLAAVAAPLTARADRPPSPFKVAATLEQQAGAAWLRLEFTVPPDHVLYAERLKFQTGGGDPLEPAKIPAPASAVDKVTGHEKLVYNRPFAAELKLGALPLNLVVKFQGCSNSACYFPEQHRFSVTTNGVVEERASLAHPDPIAAAAAFESAADWQSEVSNFHVLARGTGYMSAGQFLKFLTRAESGVATNDDPLTRYQKLGLTATLLLIVLGGAGLNLTPCVLPLIPINLAIIGAGARARSRQQGFLLGAAYGAGMALAYGALGLVVVLTGSKFGTLNASPWFNAAMSLVFLALALAMFDRFHLDFSRFQGGIGRLARSGGSRAVMAFSLGAMAALLAGACVAPVVVSVLLLSTQLYTQGGVAGLLLPFLLGLGMALPWPFAGAGLTFLPKPGGWMSGVKYAFGGLILLFSVYYGHLAYALQQTQSRTTGLAAAPVTGGTSPRTPDNGLAAALLQARESHRPVLIDFAASWCKNCVAMDETVFNQSIVQDRLKDFVVVRYEAEQPNASPVRDVLDRFRVVGLPTYVLMKPSE